LRRFADGDAARPSRPPRGARSRLAGPLLLLASLAVAGVALELGLRAFVPRSRLLDPAEDAFWKLRFQEQARGRLDPLAFGNVSFHPVLGWAPRPLLRRPERGESTNSRGARGEAEHAYARTEGRARIVVLGDSFSYGLGVPDDAVWTARLERALPGTEVVNLAANGYGTDQQLLAWLLEGAKYEPDRVLLAFFVPDFDRNALRFRELAKPRFVPHDGALRLEPLAVGRPEDLLAESERVALGPLRVGDALGFARRRIAGESEARFAHKAEVLRGLLRILAASVALQGAELRLVVIPDQRYGRSRRAAEIAALAAAAARELGVPVLDLTGPLERAQAASADAFYGTASAHWTEAGHAAAAARIAEFLAAP
jgi:lysophospholipase L1-like esterase